MNRLLGPEAVDLEASEMGIRSAMHRLGGTLLEKVLNADGGGYSGKDVACSQGHPARFVDTRVKEVVTVLGRVEVQRAYYHCRVCAAGVIPKDEVLDLEGTRFSPGVRRMMSRVGSKESFEEGRKDLEELADVVVTAKQVERISEQTGAEAQQLFDSPPARSADTVVPFQPAVKLYIAYDGTGVPVVRRETEGRASKQDNGQAKTREAKVGCVFTQTKVDAEGYPVRDEGSTSYVGAIETADAFGPRIYAEARRRGLDHAQSVIVLGDGARWIWNLAEEHFPDAIQIVDLYHARQHLAELAKLVDGPSGAEWKSWAEARYQELDQGKVEFVVGALMRLKSGKSEVQHAIEKAIGYFQNNAERMRYAEFRHQGLFVGSGVVEAGCKTLVGLRLKQSGMHWTIRGANAILALRCLDLSGRWEDFWESRTAS